MSWNVKEIAELIPARFRRFIVDNNLIYKAIAKSGDTHMRQLIVIWTNHIEKNGDVDETCPVCLKRILDNFRAIQPALVELVKTDNLLDDA